MTQTIEHVDRPERLAPLCDRLREAGSFALDMEFAGERSYFPKLHLVQVATPEVAATIDPLAIDDLGCLWDIVCDPGIRKITHAGRQDAEIVMNHAGQPPRGWTDTQVAAALLGMGDQIGYANLVGRLLGVKIKKTERVTDWSRRPLTDAQVKYALDDVIHLLPAFDRLLGELEEFGRLSWLAEEVAYYTDPSTYGRDPDTAWKRVSGKRPLDRRGLAILRELARWREHEAMRRDCPRNRVVTDDVLVEIAMRRPEHPRDLRPLRRLHPRELERHGEALVAAVDAGRAVPEADLPRVGSGMPPEDPDLALVANLMDVVLRMRAKEHRIAPSVLSNSKGLRYLTDWLAGRIDEGEEPHLLRGWRHELVGADLVALFEGNLCVQVDPEIRAPRILDGDRV